MADLIDTTEMYLRTILELEEEGVPPLRARISERLGHSGPTVSQTIGRMERDGLVVVTEDRRLEFTEEGQQKAVQVMRKHRLAERLLSDVIGLEWEYVHEEACRWEHVMSEQVERKLLKVLGNPSESPYGNPIPGLAELGIEPQGRQQAPTAPATHVAQGGAEVRVLIRRLAEPAQVDPELLLQLAEAGVIPGNYATLSQVDGHVRVHTDGAEEALDLSPEIAAFVFVERAS
ncbi:metal-dependent transcriptional regulator [Leucobacter sp. UCMA 4100]|uniref:metal-dependent transcriptional regulator n=1 Tax=Leucobacter TaxID=55968 RepID=UPI001C2407A5|nr:MULTISPECIES: metal-dependent transcriptional regulator [Leucobacter]MDA3147471.1 metal-dependent transcriptional regulator [Leucobacter sp. UCMA 4100]